MAFSLELRCTAPPQNLVFTHGAFLGERCFLLCEGGYEVYSTDAAGSEGFSLAWSVPRCYPADSGFAELGADAAFPSDAPLQARSLRATSERLVMEVRWGAVQASRPGYRRRFASLPPENFGLDLGLDPGIGLAPFADAAQNQAIFVHRGGVLLYDAAGPTSTNPVVQVYDAAVTYVRTFMFAARRVISLAIRLPVPENELGEVDETEIPEARLLGGPDSRLSICSAETVNVLQTTGSLFFSLADARFFQPRDVLMYRGRIEFFARERYKIVKGRRETVLGFWGREPLAEESTIAREFASVQHKNGFFVCETDPGSTALLVEQTSADVVFSIARGDVFSRTIFCAWSNLQQTVALFEVQPARMAVARALGPDIHFPAPVNWRIGGFVLGPRY